VTLKNIYPTQLLEPIAAQMMAAIIMAEYRTVHMSMEAAADRAVEAANALLDAVYASHAAAQMRAKAGL